MNVDELKANLLSAPWRKYKDVTVEGTTGPVQLVIRRPPDARVAELLRKAKEEGLLTEKGEPTSPEAGLRLRARVVALTLFAPNAVRPLFTEEEVLEAPFLPELGDDCTAALAGTGASLEKLKGNSAATPT
ncbi:hypothetical protein [Hyalangium versicolor]|uniref:hypothetical protein n=1 Tax=Hyalangium versicolor TaxID=2861190 RepID=UPI001CCD3D69|nr:hypothetical protein [Hyalangium versicolor]